MPRQPKEIRVLHASADYYEPLFRARFVRAMKEVQRKVSINSLALSMGNLRQAKDLIPRQLLQDTLSKACKKVLRDAYMRGGKLGAEHVKDLLNG